MIHKVTIELDEQGFQEYTNAITAYRNAEVVAYATDIEILGYGKQDRRVVGMNVYFLEETEVITLLRNEIKGLQER